MVDKTPIPQRSNSTLELVTDLNSGNVAHLNSTDNSLFLQFNQLSRVEVGDFEALFLKYNGENVASIHVEGHVATRMEIELVRSGVIEP